MTPLMVYLSCHGLLSFDLMMKMSNDKSTTTGTGTATGTTTGTAPTNRLLSLKTTLEKGFKWNIIESIMAFQSCTNELGMPFREHIDIDDDDPDPDPDDPYQDSLLLLSYPFIKAAMLKQCDLDIVYNLACYDIGLLCSYTF